MASSLTIASSLNGAIVLRLMSSLNRPFIVLFEQQRRFNRAAANRIEQKLI
jgi:hypothetical protein